MNTPPRLEWICTSADDLRKTLDCAWRDGRLSTLLPEMRATRDFLECCIGQTTRRKILERFIRRVNTQEIIRDDQLRRQGVRP